MKQFLRSLIFKIAKTSKKYKQSKLYILFIVITLAIGFAILITTSIKFLLSNFLILSVKMAIVGQYASYIITNIFLQIKQTEPIKNGFKKYFSKLDSIFDVVVTIIYAILCNLVYLAGQNLSLQQQYFMSASNILLMSIIIAKWIKILFRAVCQSVDKKHIAMQNADYRNFNNAVGYNKESINKGIIDMNMEANDEKQQGKYRQLNEQMEGEVQIEPKQEKSGAQPKFSKIKERKQNKNIIKMIQMASLPRSYLENKKYQDFNEDNQQNKHQDLLGQEVKPSNTQNNEEPGIKKSSEFDAFSNFDAL